MRLTTRVIFALTLLLPAALCCVREARAQQPGAAQAPAASAHAGAGAEGGFRLKGIDGKFYDTSEMQGDVLVVSFGATWCVPCTWEQVAVEELKAEYSGRPVRFLWVSIEDAKRISNNILRHYAKERRMTVPVLRDPGGVALAQYERTGTRIPVVVFFDRGGRQSGPAHKGMPQDITVYKQLVRERVNRLLAARPEGAGAAAPSR